MDAEDLVQDAFLRALRSWRRYTPGTRMLAWLRTILYRRFVSELRARRRLVPLASAEDALRLEPGGRRLSSTTVDPLLAAELGAAFALLTPALSESVRLSDWEGFGDEEIAAIADIPVGTAKSRLSRGRRLLRLAMHDAGLERGFREAGASRR